MTKGTSQKKRQKDCKNQNQPHNYIYDNQQQRLLKRLFIYVCMNIYICTYIFKQKEAINLTVEKALEKDKEGHLKKQEELCNSISFKTYLQTHTKF